jgi:hypothetical protein
VEYCRFTANRKGATGWRVRPGPATRLILGITLSPRRPFAPRRRDEPTAVILEESRAIFRLHPKKPNLACDKLSVATLPNVKGFAIPKVFAGIGEDKAASRRSLREPIEGGSHAALCQVLRYCFRHGKCRLACRVSVRRQPSTSSSAPTHPVNFAS